MNLKIDESESPDLALQNCPPMLQETINGSKAWLLSELSQKDWIIKLDENALKEFHIMADKIRKNPLPNILRTHEKFKIPHLRLSKKQF